MAAMGGYTIKNYRELQLHSLSTVGTAIIDGLLAPYARSYFIDGVDPELAGREISYAIQDPENSDKLALLRLWQRDGSILYSSRDGVGIEDHDLSDVAQAFAGVTVVRLEEIAPERPEIGIPYPHFEMYAPIHDPQTGEIIVVGELYQEASELLADRTTFVRMTWTATMAATLGVLALLSLSFRQSRLLRSRLEAESRLLTQNLRLRLDADRARMNAVQANEQVLNMVGAELHDGPVQLLGLLTLLPEGTSRTDLTGKVVQQLRAIAAGLILPELDGLSTAQVIELAVHRHRGLIDEDVQTTLSNLPDTLGPAQKVCLYRVVQEGLTNAFRHSEGAEVHLSVSTKDEQIRITIRSGPAKPRDAAQRPEPAVGLGLQAIQRRLDSLGGNIRLERSPNDTVLYVEIPISESDANVARINSGGTRWANRH